MKHVYLVTTGGQRNWYNEDEYTIRGIYETRELAEQAKRDMSVNYRSYQLNDVEEWAVNS